MMDLLGIPDFNFAIILTYFIWFIVLLAFAIPVFLFSITFWMGVIRAFFKAAIDDTKNNKY